MDKFLYFDNAASAQKPESVVMAEVDFLRNHYANAGRGVCAIATAVDDIVQSVRVSVSEFIGANPKQIIFTSGTTDGMNRIANMLRSDSVVAVSDIDHHSARLPFEMKYKTVLCSLDAEYNLSDIPLADVVVITAMSNVLGMPQDVKKLVAAARAKNPDVITIVDAAQYVAHLPIDVSDWDCDFLCFSGHKIGADTGVGVMYIKEPRKWHPDKFGGGMVKKVNRAQSTEHRELVLEDSPQKFEAGTLPLTQIVGLGVAIKELTEHRAQSTVIVKYLHSELSKIPRVKLLTHNDAAMVSFVVDGMSVLDFGVMAGAHGVCLRVGNMCASMIHQKMGIDGSIRLSPGPQNTMNDAIQVIEIIKKIVKE